MENTSLEESIKYYRQALKDGYSCLSYGGYFFTYLSRRLNMRQGFNDPYSTMREAWISYLYQNDKENIKQTLENFINQY